MLGIRLLLNNNFNFRNDEKKTLGHLNDRLAQYIDRVRSLELDNGKLQTQVTDIETWYMFHLKTFIYIFLLRLRYSYALWNVES